jgi:2-(1,2-epoxy-1,2-dihydrophenyl)acetyl-CoA isomerase
MDVLYEIDERVALITLNRPERLNAVTPQLTTALCEALERSMQDSAAAVILTGAGRAFCAGHDLKQEATAEDEAWRTQQVMRLVRRSPAPVIAAVHGYAVGAGCEFALCSDLIVAGEKARFGFPEVSVGLAITGGISHVLPLTVGAARAKELVLLGGQFTAQRAYELGLVNRVVPDDTILTQARSLADQLASLPANALQYAKRVLDTGPQVDLETAMHLEQVYASAALLSQNAREAALEFRSRSGANGTPQPAPRQGQSVEER